MALGPGGKEVGRVSVRVVPETSKFRRDLKKKLSKVNETVKVKVLVDSKGLKRSVKEAVDGASTTVKVPVDADTASARNKVRGLADEVDRMKFDIDIPMNGLERVIGNVVANAMRIREALVKSSSSVIDMTKRAANLKSHFQNAALGAVRMGESIRKIRFSSISNGIKRIGTGFTTAGRAGRSAFAGIGKILSGALSGAMTAVQGIGSGLAKGVSQMAELGRTGWIVLAVILLIAPALGLIGTLIAGLPSLLFAVGAPLAAIALGWDKIKESAKALEPQFNSLKEKIGTAFAEGLKPVFDQLGSLFPTLERGMLAVTNGLTFMAQQFTGVVTAGQGMFQIEAILANVGTFLQSLGPFITGFTQGLLTLAEVGSGSFGQLAMVLNNFGTRWNEMATRLAQSGQLTTALQGIAQVTDSLLNSFLRFTEAGVTAMSSMAGPMTTFINGFTDAFVALMPALTSVANLLFNVLGTALSALAPVFTALTPAFTMLADSLGTLLVGAIQALVPILMPLAQILSTVFLTALQAIQPILPVITDTMMILGQAIGGALLQAFTALTPLIQLTGQFLGQLLQAVAPILPMLAQLAGQILMALVQALTPLIPPIMQLASVLFPAIMQVVQALMPVLMLLVQAFIQLLPPIIGFIATIAEAAIPIIQALSDIISAVMPYIVGIIQGAMDIISGIINLVMGIITGDWSRAWEGLKQILSGAWEVIKNVVMGGIELVVSFFREMPGAILSALGDLGSLLFGAGKAIIQGLWDGLKALWESVKGWVSGIADWISQNKGPISKDRRLLIPAGRAIMDGLQKGLQQNFRDVQATVHRMTPQLERAFGGLDLASAITDGTPGAVASVESLVNAANKSANFQWQGEVESDGFGSIADRVAEALAGWGINLDQNGLMKLVNKANTRKARRR